ncbi:DnaJ-domain-containing protein [Piedraia hortae CBS 480.64]|uniref:DnaJ-domain-containing protein n=1 Tax=Piedraia hortae CBS 480.64 TaxID=1314780 RepID=A0A6A7BRU6_9PEZI|nr:DnaJ-domain-containing protein [Piedraia hortae CBS 480.64]
MKNNLKKGEQWAKDNNVSADKVLNSSLADDMKSLPFQVQSTSNTAKWVAVRLGGLENEVMEDNETTFEQLYERIDKTVAYLNKVKPDHFKGKENDQVVVKFPGLELKFTGVDYLQTFALPNFFFHQTMLYAFLRKLGVPLGKQDFLWIPTPLLSATFPLSLPTMRFLLTLALCCLAIVCAAAAEDYYKLLGIDRNADDRDIKKAYRRLSKKYHPDKNPDNSTVHKAFVAVAEAYEVLIDPEQRQIYDAHGHEGLARHKQGGGTAHDPFDLFSRFFGGSGHFGGRAGPRRGPDMEARLLVPLRDFYTGAEQTFTVEKEGICEKCEGSGSADGQRERCGRCGGQGVIIQKQMLAPGMFQQIQMPCDICGGTGSTVKHRCQTCGGRRVVSRQETYKVTIDRGAAAGSRVRFENEANESPDHVAGDLYVVLQQAPPEGNDTNGAFFRRKGQHLFWREPLSLREAWMGGWERKLTHLDGHTVTLSRPKGTVVQPNAVDVIQGEGMPLPRRNDDDGEQEYGALHVEYLVVLPDQMDGKLRKEFAKVWDKHAGHQEL